MQASCESCALSLTTPQNGQTVDFIFVTRAPSQGCAVKLQKGFHARSQRTSASTARIPCSSGVIR
jgi:hypothetical protein